MLIQTLTMRLITLTNRIQNWNNSEYVTIALAPFPSVGGHQKKRFPSAIRERGAARLPFIGSTIRRMPQFPLNCNKKPPNREAFAAI